MGRVTAVRPPPPERARRGRVGREPGVSALWVFHHPRAMGRSPLARGPCLSSCPTSPACEHHQAERGGRGSIAPPPPSQGLWDRDIFQLHQPLQSLAGLQRLLQPSLRGTPLPRGSHAAVWAPAHAAAAIWVLMPIRSHLTGTIHSTRWPRKWLQKAAAGSWSCSGNLVGPCTPR